MHIFVSYVMEGCVHFSFVPHMPMRRRNICSARAITAVGWLGRKANIVRNGQAGGAYSDGAFCLNGLFFKQISAPLDIGRAKEL